ncbi:MAG: hypothetical protein K2J06_03205 [Muribaculaceae bacterium]|nr:hypothetical protein [Muribaculaceae bacterium]
MNNTLIIDGKEYPCTRTMSANFDFKDVTGKEVSEMDPTSITELLIFIWACLRGACKRAEIDFPYPTPRDLAVYLDDSHIEQWSALMTAGNEDESKKKQAQKKPSPAKK